MQPVDGKYPTGALRRKVKDFVEERRVIRGVADGARARELLDESAELTKSAIDEWKMENVGAQRRTILGFLTNVPQADENAWSLFHAFEFQRTSAANVIAAGRLQAHNATRGNGPGGPGPNIRLGQIRAQYRVKEQSGAIQPYGGVAPELLAEEAQFLIMEVFPRLAQGPNMYKAIVGHLNGSARLSAADLELGMPLVEAIARTETLSAAVFDDWENDYYAMEHNKKPAETERIATELQADAFTASQLLALQLVLLRLFDED